MTTGVLSLMVECRNPCETTVRLSASWLAPNQNSFAIRVRAYADAAAPGKMQSSLLRVGKGLQNTTYLPSPVRLKTDPSRVLLSSDEKSQDQGELAFSGGQLSVQGLVADGMTKVEGEFANGGRLELRVYHFASTLMMRSANDYGPKLDEEVTLPVTAVEQTVAILPALVEPTKSNTPKDTSI